MINRRSFITTASAFMAATHLPAMPVLAEDTLSIEGKRLFIDEPIFVNLNGFRSFKMDGCTLVFRGAGAFVISDDAGWLARFSCPPEHMSMFEIARTNGKKVLISGCALVDERTPDILKTYFEASHVALRDGQQDRPGFAQDNFIQNCAVIIKLST